jgi:hypothetical protein
MKTPEIRVWREPIDGIAMAICASTEMVLRGNLYRASAFFLGDGSRYHDWKYDWRQLGAQRLKDHLRDEHAGRIPYVGRAVEQA